MKTPKPMTIAEMARKGGKIGGKAKVPKGFAKMDPKRRREIAIKAAKTKKEKREKEGTNHDNQ